MLLRLRWHKGTFYLITTNVSGGGNFIVTAKDPQGPMVRTSFFGRMPGGIDPSLFFDEDGTCYYIGQRAKFPMAAGTMVIAKYGYRSWI